jgi:hypothetical protein
MRRWAFAALAAALIACSTSTARAEVNVERVGSENAMAEVFKSTIYGALAGLVVGGAISLAAADDSGEPIRWGIVAGTAIGLGYGIYQVATRPQPTALLELKDGGLLAHSLPTFEAHPGGAKVYLLSTSF